MNSSIFNLSNAVYDKIRIIVQIWMPAISVFYTAIANIWGFGYVEQIVGTIAAITVLLGAILGLSRKNFNAGNAPDQAYDGELLVDSSNPVEGTFMQLDADPTTLTSKDKITLQVKPLSQD